MKESLVGTIREAIGRLQANGAWPAFDVPDITVEYPKNDAFGDYTTNAAMILAKPVGKNPMDIAADLAGALREGIAGDGPVGRIEVSAPGYVNFLLSERYVQSVVADISEQGEAFGNLGTGAGIAVNNEFVSANPTGPMHLGNGRGGFYGDALARVLRKAGYSVTNEYYVNDAGEQVVKLGHSVLKDDEAVYAGEYIDALRSDLDKEGVPFRDPRAVGERAADIILEEHIKKTLADRMRVSFDSFISERRDLVGSGLADRAVDRLKAKGLAYESEGALWLRTTDFGDDKDRVLVKRDGTRTYFASDCGYLLSKMERGFTVLIETWGADHHGYITRIRAAAEALGFTGELRFVIVQLVRLMKDGKEVRMSKRAGNVVYIDELLDRVGHDVTRFLFLMYSPDTHMNFDLGLAEERSQKNPVFFVQYAHARLSNILAKACEEGWDTGVSGNPDLLVHVRELALLRELRRFPELIGSVAESYAVHQLPQYAIRLADRLHGFYDECRVVDADAPELSRARLALVRAARTVLGETLRLIGVSAPDRM